MTARETTLGALTAADLGKRVRVLGRGRVGVLDRYRREYLPTGAPRVYIERDYGDSVTFSELDPDTPVTIYDEEADRG